MKVKIVSRDGSIEIDGPNGAGEISITVCPEQVHDFDGYYFSVRTENALKKAGLKSLREITRWSERDLKLVSGVGPGVIEEIKHALESQGMALSDRNHGSIEDIKRRLIEQNSTTQIHLSADESNALSNALSIAAQSTLDNPVK